jgi:murein DD-endopeptidase MepM/ murein hydrolase activator NlpD
MPEANPLPPTGLILNLDLLSANFCYPYRGNRISDYGMRGGSMHTGVDIKAIPNDTIRAAFDGIVRMSRNYSGYGNTIVIQHPYGFETLYSHNSRNLVRVNERVNAGQPIALAGRTGRATTEHLHFEVRVAGEHINPNLLLDCAGMKLQTGELNITMSGNRIVASNSHLGSSSTTVSATSAASSASVHTVARGDTLSSISRRYGVSIDALCRLNGISRNGILRIGQRIILR